MFELEPRESEPRDDDPRFRAALDKARREKKRRKRRGERERNQRDMGIGYLIQVARLRRRMSQGRLAKKMRTSRSAVARWEAGAQLPTLRTMQSVCIATDLELIVGLQEPPPISDGNGPPEKAGKLLALGVLEDEWNMTELRMLWDDRGLEWVPPVPWRQKLENPESDSEDEPEVRATAPPPAAKPWIIEDDF